MQAIQQQNPRSGGAAPGCTTGAEVTVGVHWFRGVSFEPVERVLDQLSMAVGAVPEMRPGGKHAYDTTFQIGPLQLWWHTTREEQGVCVEVTGSACEALGVDGLLKVWNAADWRTSRLDLAADHAPFTPGMVRDAWRSGNVNTRVKVAKLLDDAGEWAVKEGREEWRRSEWVEAPSGDMFTMGSRASMQYARCYDRRGFTRFELELKSDTAAAAAPLVMEALRQGPQAMGPVTVGLIQRFVKFVDRGADSNLGRCPELAWWAAFTEGVERARLWLGERVVRTVEEIKRWAERQVAPSLALLREALGDQLLGALIEKGKPRWRTHHREALALWGYTGNAAAS